MMRRDPARSSQRDYSGVVKLSQTKDKTIGEVVLVTTPSPAAGVPVRRGGALRYRVDLADRSGFEVEQPPGASGTRRAVPTPLSPHDQAAPGCGR
jgi:hypothetical protein